MNNYIMAIPAVYFVLTAIPLCITDIKEQRLPNKIVLPGTLLALLGLLITGINGEGVRSLVAFAIGLVSFFALLAVNILDVLGMGDVKLLATLCFIVAWISPWAPLILMGITIVLSFLLSIINLMFTNPLRSIPFGPYIMAGFFGTLAVTLL